jgi:hypothetical protein
MGLEQVVGQFGMGPVGPVQPLSDRPLDDQAADLLTQVSRDLRLSALGLARPQAGESVLQVGVEPTLDGAGGHPQVGGDVRVLAAPMGEPDDLDSVAGNFSITPGEAAFQLVGFGHAAASTRSP